MIMTRKEAAALLKMSVRSLDEIIASGRLAVSKFGRAIRINRADVVALVPPGGGVGATKAKGGAT